MQDKCYLVLSDGTVFKGKSFGHPAPLVSKLVNGKIINKAAGEVVFNTGMSGYHEILTDPSYTGQLVTMTYPHIGNYGSDDAWSEVGPEQGKKLQVKASGFVVRSLYKGPVTEGRLTLDKYLSNNLTPGITDIDTRALTLKIRDGGSPSGIIVSSESEDLTEDEKAKCIDYLKTFPSMEGRNLVKEVGSNEVKIFDIEKPKKHFAVIDCGVKANIIRDLLSVGCKVTLVPSTSTAEEVLKLNTDAVLISNGPGDPAVLGDLIELAKGLIGKKPLFGICLGHQLISLALGASTFKMKFGHHGCNHPVRDEKTKKVFVTSQNHGFSVDEKSIPKDVEVWFKNANDGTVEGIAHKTLPILTAQFHPEAAPGPEDSFWIFDAFVNKITS